uniref:Uncharacterized protein n=1 Tax=Rhizophagus irregularis (strain DAOM 181602 / DAOM 197198 / MUCL 43194) TaxID=747089 RepID=U9SLD0_RHIID
MLLAGYKEIQGQSIIAENKESWEMIRDQKFSFSSITLIFSPTLKLVKHEDSFINLIGV